MKKLDLHGWAALAEIVGTVAVVVSLLFVAFSVNRNTLIVQAANENALIQMNDEIIAGLLSNSDILSIVDKRESGQDLSNVENMSMAVFTLRQFNVWEMAYYRHKDGLYTPERWIVVNEGYADGLMNGFSACDADCWALWRTGFADDFTEHVDSEYEKKVQTN